MIKLMDTTLFVHPIPTRLARRHKRSLPGVPHVIVKKSVQNKASLCDLEGKKSKLILYYPV